MLGLMMTELDIQAPTEVGTPVVDSDADPVGNDVQSTSGVAWHLSPGYSTHLHAYELAMLPGDPRRSDS